MASTSLLLNGYPDAASDDRRGWTVARLLREARGELRLRRRFREHPLLEWVTLGSLLENPLRLDAFLAECRLLPQCGDTQVARLRQLLVQEFATGRAGTAGTGTPGALPGDVQAGVAMPVQSPDAPRRVLPLHAEFEPDSVGAIDNVFLRMWRLARFHPFVYLPVSVPEIFKTPEVLAAELGREQDLSVYLGKLAAIRRSLGLTGNCSGTILIDSHALGAILSRQGRYRGLGEAAVDRQRTALREMLAKLPAGINCHVTDFETARLTSGVIVGEHLVLHAMGGYMLVHDPSMLAQIAARCETASRGARSLGDFLDETK